MLKNYSVTHIATGEVTTHVGFSATQLSSGTSDTSYWNRSVPACNWNPDRTVWVVREEPAKFLVMKVTGSPGDRRIFGGF